MDFKLIDNHHQIQKMFFSSYHASRKNKILTATSILLSFDLRKSEVEEREKRERSWCHNYLFLMSLLLVSNNINRQWNFKGKSPFTRCENNKSRITLLCPITPHATNLGSITRHGKPLRHAEKGLFWKKRWGNCFLFNPQQDAEQNILVARTLLDSHSARINLYPH